MATEDNGWQRGRQLSEQTERWMDRRAGRRMDKWTEGKKDIWTERETVRWIDREKNSLTYGLNVIKTDGYWERGKQTGGRRKTITIISPL